MTGPSPDRSGETPWSELEKSFFASAPPDVPQPAPEPMRFDDLAPIETAKPQDVASFRREIPTGMRRAVNAATATRAAMKQVLGGAGRRVRPALASVKGGAVTIASAAARGSKSAFAATARGSKAALAAAARGSRAALAAARGASVRTVGAGRRLGAVFAARRSFAVAVAVAVVATGISVGVVASRDGAGPNQIASTPPAPALPPAITAPAPVEPPPPVAAPGPTVIAQAAPAEPQPAPAEPEPAPASIAPPAPAPAPAPQARPSSPAAERRPAQTAAPKRPTRPHRRQPTYSARNDLIIPSFMTSSPRQEPGNRPPPAPSNRPFFSR